MTHYILFVMELTTRRVICAGITPHPNAAWILQVGRNLTDAFTGFLRGKEFLIMDRDSSFYAAFRSLLEQAGTRPLRTPPSSPNYNAHIERFHGSFKREVADRSASFSIIDEFLEYYHRERNHQGLDGQIIDKTKCIGFSEGKLQQRERLGGMLNYYHREAA